MQSDHTYGRGKVYCLNDCRPVCSENRIPGLTDLATKFLRLCVKYVRLSSCVGQSGSALQKEGFAGKLKKLSSIVVFNL